MDILWITKEVVMMPLYLLGTALKVVGAAGMLASGAVIVTKVLLDTGILP